MAQPIRHGVRGRPRPARCPEPLCPHQVLPATTWRLAPRQRALPLLHCSYELMRQTTTLLPALVSLVRQVFAGCCQSLLGGGLSRRYLHESFSGCLDPYPGASPGAHTRFFPGNIGLHRLKTGSAKRHNPYRDFRTGLITGLQSFSDVQASGFARHPGRSYRSGSTGQPWLLRPSRTCVVTFTGIGYASRPNRAIDGVGTYTPLDSRPCRPLP